MEHNESLERFHRHICISSFKMIIDLIKSGYGISFVYEVLAKSDPDLGIFTLKGEPIVREFNVIYLKHADVREKMEWFYDRLRLYSLGVIQNCFLKAVGRLEYCR